MLFFRKSPWQVVQNRVHRESNQLRIVSFIDSPRDPDILCRTVHCLYWPKCDLGDARVDLQYFKMGKWSLILFYLTRPKMTFHFTSLWRESVTWPLEKTQSMSLGYFLADYIVLIHTRELGGTVPILAHHTTATMAYLVSLWYNKMGWYSCFRLLSEFSTPFVNLRFVKR